MLNLKISKKIKNKEIKKTLNEIHNYYHDGFMQKASTDSLHQ